MSTTYNPRIEAAESYIAAIRNRNKKLYARAYSRFLMCPAMGEPSSSNFQLSVMGAQAVRLQLQSIFNS